MVIGLNYRTAPIEIRERFTFEDDTIGIALEKLKNTKSVLEAVILSTCNRVEVYAIVDQLHTGEHFIKKFLSQWFDMDKSRFTPFLDIKVNAEATEHLFRVVNGLDSMILGETQILGQVRHAFLTAQQYQTTGILFNQLFKQAITFAKKVHTETGIDANAVSVSYAAVELAKKIYESLDDKAVLIVGAGETSELTAIHLFSHGVKQVMVANRTLDKAKELANTFKGIPYTLDQLAIALERADIVISSTGASTAIIDRELVSKVMKNRGDKPLFFIDIAVPRDIAPEVNQLENVFLYDIDDLNGIVDINLKERQKIAIQIEGWIEEEVYVFYQWINTLGVIPLVAALREKSFKIQEETMNSLQNKLPYLNERELSVIRKHTKSIVNQMLKDPIMRIKEAAAEPEAKEMMEYFKSIFALNEELIKSNPVYENLSKQQNASPTGSIHWLLKSRAGLK